MPDGWVIASHVLVVLGAVAGLEVGLAFLMRAPKAALDDDR